MSGAEPIPEPGAISAMVTGQYRDGWPGFCADTRTPPRTPDMSWPEELEYPADDDEEVTCHAGVCLRSEVRSVPLVAVRVGREVQPAPDRLIVSPMTSEEQAVIRNAGPEGAPRVRPGSDRAEFTYAVSIPVRVYQGCIPATSSTVHATDR